MIAIVVSLQAAYGLTRNADFYTFDLIVGTDCSVSNTYFELQLQQNDALRTCKYQFAQADALPRTIADSAWSCVPALTTAQFTALIADPASGWSFSMRSYDGLTPPTFSNAVRWTANPVDNQPDAVSQRAASVDVSDASTPKIYRALLSGSASATTTLAGCSSFQFLIREPISDTWLVHKKIITSQAGPVAFNLGTTASTANFDLMSRSTGQLQQLDSTTYATVVNNLNNGYVQIGFTCMVNGYRIYQLYQTIAPSTGLTGADALIDTVHTPITQSLAVYVAPTLTIAVFNGQSSRAINAGETLQVVATFTDIYNATKYDSDVTDYIPYVGEVSTTTLNMRWLQLTFTGVSKLTSVFDIYNRAAYNISVFIYKKANIAHNFTISLPNFMKNYIQYQMSQPIHQFSLYINSVVIGQRYFNLTVQKLDGSVTHSWITSVNTATQTTWPNVIDFTVDNMLTSAGVSCGNNTYSEGNYVAWVTHGSLPDGNGTKMFLPVFVSGNTLQVYINSQTTGGSEMENMIFGFNNTMPALCDPGVGPNFQFSALTYNSPTYTVFSMAKSLPTGGNLSFVPIWSVSYAAKTQKNISGTYSILQALSPDITTFITAFNQYPQLSFTCQLSGIRKQYFVQVSSLTIATWAGTTDTYVNPSVITSKSIQYDSQNQIFSFMWNVTPPQLFKNLSIGDSIKITVQMNTIEQSPKVVRSDSTFLVVTADYIAQTSLQNVNLQVNVSNSSAATIFKQYIDSGQYQLKIIMSQNNMAEVEFNPGDQHVCRAYNDRFSVIFDTTNIASDTIFSLFVRKSDSIKLYNASITLKPTSSFTQIDFMDSLLNIQNISPGQFSAYAAIGSITQYLKVGQMINSNTLVNKVKILTAQNLATQYFKGLRLVFNSQTIPKCDVNQSFNLLLQTHNLDYSMLSMQNLTQINIGSVAGSTITGASYAFAPANFQKIQLDINSNIINSTDLGSYYIDNFYSSFTSIMPIVAMTCQLNGTRQYQIYHVETNPSDDDSSIFVDPFTTQVATPSSNPMNITFSPTSVATADGGTGRFTANLTNISGGFQPGDNLKMWIQMISTINQSVSYFSDPLYFIPTHQVIKNGLLSVQQLEFLVTRGDPTEQKMIRLAMYSLYAQQNHKIFVIIQKSGALQNITKQFSNQFYHILQRNQNDRFQVYANRDFFLNQISGITKVSMKLYIMKTYDPLLFQSNVQNQSISTSSNQTLVFEFLDINIKNDNNTINSSDIATQNSFVGYFSWSGLDDYGTSGGIVPVTIPGMSNIVSISSPSLSTLASIIPSLLSSYTNISYLNFGSNNSFNSSVCEDQSAANYFLRGANGDLSLVSKQIVKLGVNSSLTSTSLGCQNINNCSQKISMGQIYDKLADLSSFSSSFQTFPTIGITCMNGPFRKYQLFQVVGFETISSFASANYPLVDPSSYIVPTSKSVGLDGGRGIFYVNVVKAASVHAGDAVRIVLQMITPQQSYNFTPTYIVPCLGTQQTLGTVSDQNQLSASFNVSIQKHLIPSVFLSWNSGSYSLRIIIFVNGILTSDYNPDEVSFITKLQGKFSVTLDTSGFQTQQLMTLVIMIDNQFSPFSSSQIVSPQSVTTLVDFPDSSFQNLPNVSVGKYTAQLFYTESGLIKSIFLKVIGNVNKAQAQISMDQQTVKLVLSGISMPKCDNGFGANIILAASGITSQLLSMKIVKSVNQNDTSITIKTVNLQKISISNGDITQSSVIGTFFKDSFYLAFKSMPFLGLTCQQNGRRMYQMYHFEKQPIDSDANIGVDNYIQPLLSTSNYCEYLSSGPKFQVGLLFTSSSFIIGDNLNMRILLSSLTDQNVHYSSDFVFVTPTISPTAQTTFSMIIEFQISKDNTAIQSLYNTGNFKSILQIFKSGSVKAQEIEFENTVKSQVYRYLNPLTQTYDGFYLNASYASLKSFGCSGGCVGTALDMYAILFIYASTMTSNSTDYFTSVPIKVTVNMSDASQKYIQFYFSNSKLMNSQFSYISTTDFNSQFSFVAYSSYSFGAATTGDTIILPVFRQSLENSAKIIANNNGYRLNASFMNYNAISASLCDLGTYPNFAIFGHQQQNPILSKQQAKMGQNNLDIISIEINTAYIHQVAWSVSQHTSTISAGLDGLTTPTLLQFQQSIQKFAVIGLSCLKAGARQYQLFQVVQFTTSNTLLSVTDSYIAPAVPQKKSAILDYVNNRFAISIVSANPNYGSINGLQPGDTITLNVVFTIIESKIQVFSQNIVIVPTTEQISLNIQSVQVLSCSFYAAITPEQTNSIKQIYFDGSYSMKVQISRNGAPFVDYNPDQNHITHIKNSFYVVFDSTSAITKEIALSITVRQQSSIQSSISGIIKQYPSNIIDDNHHSSTITIFKFDDSNFIPNLLMNFNIGQFIARGQYCLNSGSMNNIILSVTGQSQYLTYFNLLTVGSVSKLEIQWANSSYKPSCLHGAYPNLIIGFDGAQNWAISNRTFINISNSRYENVADVGWTIFSGTYFQPFTTVALARQYFTDAFISLLLIPDVGLTCIGEQGLRIYQFYNMNTSIQVDQSLIGPIDQDSIIPSDKLNYLNQYVNQSNITLIKTQVPYYIVNIFNQSFDYNVNAFDIITVKISISINQQIYTVQHIFSPTLNEISNSNTLTTNQRVFLQDTAAAQQIVQLFDKSYFNINISLQRNIDINKELAIGKNLKSSIMRNTNNDGFIIIVIPQTVDYSAYYTLDSIQIIDQQNISLMFIQTSSAKQQKLINGQVTFQLFDTIDFVGMEKSLCINGSYIAYGTYNSGTQLFLQVINQSNIAQIQMSSLVNQHIQVSFDSTSIALQCLSGFSPNLVFGSYSVLNSNNPYWLISRRTIFDITKPQQNIDINYVKMDLRSSKLLQTANVISDTISLTNLQYIGLTCIGQSGSRIYQMYQLTTQPFLNSTPFTGVVDYWVTSSYSISLQYNNIQFTDHQLDALTYYDGTQSIKSFYQVHIINQPSLGMIVPGDAIKVSVTIRSKVKTAQIYESIEYHILQFEEVLVSGNMSLKLNVLIKDEDAPKIKSLINFNTYQYSLFVQRNIEAQLQVTVNDNTQSSISRNANNSGFILQFRPTDSCFLYKMQKLVVLLATNISQRFISSSVEKQAVNNQGTIYYQYYDALDFNNITNISFVDGNYVAYCYYLCDASITYTVHFLKIDLQNNQAMFTVDQTGSKQDVYINFAESSQMPVCLQGFNPNIIIGSHNDSSQWLISKRTVNSLKTQISVNTSNIKMQWQSLSTLTWKIGLITTIAAQAFVDVPNALLTPIIGLTCIGQKGNRIFQLYQVQIAPNIDNSASSQICSIDSYIPSEVITNNYFLFDNMQQQFTADIYDAIGFNMIEVGDAVTIQLKMSSSISNDSFVTNIYKVVTIDDLNDDKLRSRLILTKDLTPVGMYNLYLSRFFSVKAVITRNIDSSFDYELTNSITSTITRNLYKSGFIVTIRPIQGQIINDNLVVTLSLSIMKNDSLSVYSISNLSSQSNGNMAIYNITDDSLRVSGIINGNFIAFGSYSIQNKKYTLFLVTYDNLQSVSLSMNLTQIQMKTSQDQSSWCKQSQLLISSVSSTYWLQSLRTIKDTQKQVTVLVNNTVKFDGTTVLQANEDDTHTLMFVALDQPVVALTCYQSGQRKYRVLQVLQAPAQSGFDESIMDDYLPTPVANQTSAQYNVDNATFSVGLPSIPAGTSKFTVGDIVKIKLSVQPATTKKQSQPAKLQASSFQTGEVTIFVGANNINADGSLNVAVTVPIVSCGGADAVSAVMSTNSFSVSASVVQNDNQQVTIDTTPGFAVVLVDGAVGFRFTLANVQQPPCARFRIVVQSFASASMTALPTPTTTLRLEDFVKIVGGQLSSKLSEAEKSSLVLIVNEKTPAQVVCEDMATKSPAITITNIQAAVFNVSSELSGGAIAGIAVAGGCVVTAAVVLLVRCQIINRKKVLNKKRTPPAITLAGSTEISRMDEVNEQRLFPRDVAIKLRVSPKTPMRPGALRDKKGLSE